MPTSAALIALKAVAIPRRAAGASSRGSARTSNNRVRLVPHSDIGLAADEIAAHSEQLSKWMAATLLKWTSPRQNLRYAQARLRRLHTWPDAQDLTEDDLAAVAEVGHAILTTAALTNRQTRN